MGLDPCNFYTGGRKRGAVQAHNNRIVQDRRAALDSISLRSIRAQEAADEAARIEAEQAPLRALQEENARLAKDLGNAERSAVLTGHDDTEIFHDPDAPRFLYGEGEVNAYNQKEIKKFLSANPTAHWSPENIKCVSQYLDAHGYGTIVSAVVLARIWERLSGLGLLKEKPTPAPVAQTVEAAPAPEPEPPKGEWGFNISTGEPEFRTNKEVNRMDFQEYKRWTRGSVQAPPAWAQVRDQTILAPAFAALGRRDPNP